jgi:hypothetical protein
MNYLEAKKLAELWTQGHDVSLDGWRSVVMLLNQEIDSLEKTNAFLLSQIDKLNAKDRNEQNA